MHSDIFLEDLIVHLFKLRRTKGIWKCKRWFYLFCLGIKFKHYFYLVVILFVLEVKLPIMWIIQIEYDLLFLYVILDGFYESKWQINPFFGDIIIRQVLEEDNSVIRQQKKSILLLLDPNQLGIWDINEYLSTNLFKLEIILLLFQY